MKYLLPLLISVFLFSCGIEHETQIDLPLQPDSDLSENSTTLAIASSSYQKRTSYQPGLWTQDSAWRQTGRRRDPHPEQWKTADSNHSHPGHGYFGCSNGRYSPRLGTPTSRKWFIPPTLILRAVVDSDGSKALTKMVRCGLEFAGHPGTDQFINNTGDLATLDLTLHGKIQNIPASSYEIIVDRDPPHRIRIRGTVYESFFTAPSSNLLQKYPPFPGLNLFRFLIS